MTKLRVFQYAYLGAEQVRKEYIESFGIGITPEKLKKLDLIIDEIKYIKSQCQRLYNERCAEYDK